MTKKMPWVAWPVLVWFLAFLVIPVMIVSAYSFATKGVYGGIFYRFESLTELTQNFKRAFQLIYLKIFWNSVKLATLTALSCLLIGYPMAFFIATRSQIWQKILLTLVVIPFWTNFVVRAYAIKIVLGGATGDLAVWIGMVTNYLPFMVLPLYSTLEKFDFSLVEAARDLGASSWNVLTKILIPLTRPGIVTGVIFVFTPVLGEFVIPDLLGGAKTMLAGNLITDQFLKTRDWPFGAALSVILMIIVLFSLVIYQKYGEVREPSH